MASNVYISDLRTTGAFRGRIGVFDRNVLTGALTIISGGTIETGLDGGFICTSHDGKNVYVVSSANTTISIYDRNSITAELTPNGTIATGNDPIDICISFDGENVYVANQGSSFLSIYNRNISTGALTANGTIACDVPQGVAISEDGKNVYASNAYLIADAPTVIGAISIFDRNVSTGALTANGTIYTGISDTNPTKICISYNGVSLYVVNTLTDTIQAYDRNVSTGALTVFQAIATQDLPSDICISEDGASIYVVNANSNTISIYNRNASTKVLTSNGTIATESLPLQIKISSDSKNVYVSNNGSGTVSVYDRNISTGALTLNSTNGFFGDPLVGLGVYPVVFSPSNPTALVIDVQPYGVVSGDPFTTQPIIEIVNSNGDLIPTATNDVEVAITVVNGSGSLTGTTTVTAVDGYATFTDLVFTGAGSFYLTFTSIGLIEVDSDEIATLTPTELVVYVQPIAGLSGELLSTQPTITIANWLGDLVPDATDVVDVSLVDVTGSSVLTGTLNATASGGYAAFTDLIATGYGSFYLTFTSGTLTSVNSDTLFFPPDPGNPNPPIPVKPKRSYTPSSVPTSGDMVANEFAINVADKKGYVRDSNGIIHLVFDGNASGSGTVTSVGLSSTNSTLTISDSPVTTSGTIKIDLPETGVSAKAYTNADITIDVYGRITSASDGASGVTSIIAGTGVSVDTATGDVTVTNSAPDQTVSLTNGTAISVTGTYPDFTITNDAPDQAVTLTDGTGISVTGVYPDFTITNSLPDQTVSLTQGTDITITGTYPDFTIAYSGVASGVTSIIAGTGISVDVATGDVTITNSAPDQTVTLTDGTGISVTGAYPDFTIATTITQYTDSDARLSLSAGTGVSYDNTTGIITNSEPDQIVSLTGGTDISVTGTYPTFTVDYTGTNSGVTSIIAGTGISVDQATGAVTVTNTDPDQIVSITSGTGISVTGTYPSFTIATTITQYTDSDARLSLSAGTGISYDNATGIITNSAPDQTVSLTQGTDITITGTYPSFTIAYSGTSSGVSSITAGTGISVDVTTGAVTVTNSLPDQTVSLTDGTGITVTGTYPSFTITNSLPDQTVSLTDGTDISITGTYPNFTISYTGTSGSGTVTSISTTSPITGGTITGTGTIGIDASSANTASFVVQRDASGDFSAGTITASLTGNATGLVASAALTTPTITGLIEKQTAPAISAGVLALNCASGNVFAVSLNAAITSITFSNIPTSGNAFGITLAFTADGTARTISWPASVKWPSGIAPTMTSTSAKVDIFVLTTWNAGTTWFAMIGGQNF